MGGVNRMPLTVLGWLTFVSLGRLFSLELLSFVELDRHELTELRVVPHRPLEDTHRYLKRLLFLLISLLQRLDLALRLVPVSSKKQVLLNDNLILYNYILYCKFIVFFYFYSASHSMNLPEAPLTTAAPFEETIRRRSQRQHG